MKSKDKIMEIYEAYDLMGSYSGAASLLGCSHHTVKKYVDARDAGMPLKSVRKKATLTSDYEPHIWQWVEQSEGKIRADKVHEKLLVMGYQGSLRTTAYAVRRAKNLYKAGNLRVHKPWVSAPGVWLQYDFGDGPRVAGKKIVLFVAWLAWSKFRVVIPLRDKSMTQVLYALDKTFRIIGGVPTYVLSDNEKTLTIAHVAGLAVRNREIVDFGRYYGTVFHSCVPYDPASKGGVERSVALAKADIVPTKTNLEPDYVSFQEVEEACKKFMQKVNTRVHQSSKQEPVARLAVEKMKLHRVPDNPYSQVLGQARKVPSNTPMITFENGQYSVPHKYVGQQVYVRKQATSQGDIVVISATSSVTGAVEIATHKLATAGNPAINDAHFPAVSKNPLERRLKPVSKIQKDFLRIGVGAETWLRLAAFEGVQRINFKIEKAVNLAKMYGDETINQVLTIAAEFHRFNVEDFVTILETLNPETDTENSERFYVLNSDASLAQGTTGWAGFGINNKSVRPVMAEEVA